MAYFNNDYSASSTLGMGAFGSRDYLYAGTSNNGFSTSYDAFFTDDAYSDAMAVPYGHGPVEFEDSQYYEGRYEDDQPREHEYDGDPRKPHAKPSDERRLVGQGRDPSPKFEVVDPSNAPAQAQTTLTAHLPPEHTRQLNGSRFLQDPSALVDQDLNSTACGSVSDERKKKRKSTRRQQGGRTESTEEGPTLDAGQSPEEDEDLSEERSERSGKKQKRPKKTPSTAVTSRKTRQKTSSESRTSLQLEEPEPLRGQLGPKDRHHQQLYHHHPVYQLHHHQQPSQQQQQQQQHHLQSHHPPPHHQYRQHKHSASSSSSSLSLTSSSPSFHSSNFITERQFLILADEYLLSLSPKKREKALLTNAMYQKILMVLIQPKNTQVSTAQFRFWAKKMFTLSTTATHHVVCHGGKPVATKECLYDVLVYCHRKSSHGGRDKTSAEVRQHYSWVPKELIARFVKHCPLCLSRRGPQQRQGSSPVPGPGADGTGAYLNEGIPPPPPPPPPPPYPFSERRDRWQGSSSGPQLPPQHPLSYGTNFLPPSYAAVPSNEVSSILQQGFCDRSMPPGLQPSLETLHGAGMITSSNSDHPPNSHLWPWPDCMGGQYDQQHTVGQNEASEYAVGSENDPIEDQDEDEDENEDGAEDMSTDHHHQEEQQPPHPHPLTTNRMGNMKQEQVESTWRHTDTGDSDGTYDDAGDEEMQEDPSDNIALDSSAAAADNKAHHHSSLLPTTSFDSPGQSAHVPLGPVAVHPNGHILHDRHPIHNRARIIALAMTAGDQIPLPHPLPMPMPSQYHLQNTWDISQHPYSQLACPRPLGQDTILYRQHSHAAVEDEDEETGDEEMNAEDSWEGRVNEDGQVN
ncbi:hypothetical protein KVV02_000706, partial [Mortierella alpina]